MFTSRRQCWLISMSSASSVVGRGCIEYNWISFDLTKSSFFPGVGVITACQQNSLKRTQYPVHRLAIDVWVRLIGQPSFIAITHPERGYRSDWDAQNCIVFLHTLLKYSTLHFQIWLVCQNSIDRGVVLTPVAVVMSFTYSNLYWRFNAANVLSDDTQYLGNAQADIPRMHAQHAVPNPSDSFMWGADCGLQLKPDTCCKMAESGIVLVITACSWSPFVIGGRPQPFSGDWKPLTASDCTHCVFESSRCAKAWPVHAAPELH